MWGDNPDVNEFLGPFQGNVQGMGGGIQATDWQPPRVQGMGGAVQAQDGDTMPAPLVPMGSSGVQQEYDMEMPSPDVKIGPMGGGMQAAPVAAPAGGGSWSDQIKKLLGGAGGGGGGKGGGGGGSSGMNSFGSAAGGLLAKGIMALSDVRAKENVRPADGAATGLLNALRDEGPLQWDYKAAFGGQHSYGPMAQTLEKAGPMGANMVGRDANGTRFLKQPEVMKSLLAAVAEQQRQIDSIAAGPVDAEDRQRRKERQWSAGPSTDPRASIRPPPGIKATWNEGAGGYVPSDPMVAAAGRPVWDGRQWVSQGDGGAPRFRASSMSPAPPTAQR